MEVAEAQVDILVEGARFLPSSKDALLQGLQVSLYLHFNVDWLLKSNLDACFKDVTAASLNVRHRQPEPKPRVCLSTQLLDVGLY